MRASLYRIGSSSSSSSSSSMRLRLCLLILTTLSFNFSSAQNDADASSNCPLPRDARTLTSGLTMREVYHPTSNTLTVQLIHQGESWLGFGISSDGTMVGSKAVIGLPDDGSVQLYDMSGQSVDFVTPRSTQTLRNASIMQENGATSMTFTLPLDENTSNKIVATGPNTFLYAHGSSNDLGYHASRNSFTVDSLQTCNGGTTPNYDGSSPAARTIGDARSIRNRKLWMAHGLVMSLSWGLLAPMAIGCSVLRQALGNGGTWFFWHSNIMTLVFVSTAIGFGIAVYLVADANGAQFSGHPHKLLGLMVFVLVVAQVCSGWFRPHLPQHQTKESDENDFAEEGATDNVNVNEQPPGLKKSIFRIIFEIQHRLLGASILGLSWYQVYTGIGLYDDRYGLKFNAYAVFFGVAGTLVGLIVLGKVGMVGSSRRR